VVSTGYPVDDRRRDSVGDGRRGERREAADAPRPNESLRQAARLRFPGLVRCHYQFPAAQVVWQSQGGVAQKDCIGPAHALN
jgi:hypothetical protein